MWTFRSKKKKRITITFITTDNITFEPVIRMDKGLNAVAAINAIDNLKWQLSAGLNTKVHAKQFAHRDPKKMDFARKQTIGDII